MTLRLGRTAISATALSLLSIPVANAQSHAPHVHGEAEMAIVIENDAVSVSLMSPMYNITGFEHAPETDAQRVTLQSALSTLADGSQLFEVNETAGCVQSFEHNNLSDEKAHHETEHEDETDHDDGDHDHKDLEADYEFTCSHASKLKSVHVGLFDHFENLHTINTVLMRNGRQAAVKLTPSNAILTLDDLF